MNFEDITKIWQYQTNEAILIRNEASLLDEVRKQYRRGKHWLIGLNLYVLIVGVPGLCFLGWLGLKTWPNFKAVFPVAFGLLFTTVILTLFVSTRRQRVREQSFENSVKARIECLLSQANHWVWLLQAYLRWIFPAGITVWILGVTWWGLVKGLPLWGTAYILFCSLGFCAIYWSFQRIYQKKFLPRKRVLEDLLRSIESTGEHDA